jgi:hypothetical protein
MTGDPNALTIALSSFWSSTTGSSSSREADHNSCAGGAGSLENAWDELVDWFEQQHEWLTLVSSFENAYT